MVAKLKSEDPNVNPLATPVTAAQLSMIAGLLWVGGMIGSVLTSPMVDRFGRKKTIIIFGVLQTISFLLLAFGTSIYVYYVARFFVGVCFGAFVPTLAIYLPEIAESHNRGRYSSMCSAFVPFGSLYAYTLGMYFPVKVFTILCAVPSTIGILVFTVFGPESPVSLVKQENRAGAIKILRKLRGRKNVEDEIDEVGSLLKTGKANEKFNCKLLSENPAIMKGFKITVGMSILQAFCGIVAIMAFLGPIFDSAGISLSGNTVAILVGLLKATFYIFTSLVVEKLGRRTLMLISTSSATITLLLMGLYFQFKDSDWPVIQYIWWLPVFCIFGYITSYALGIGSLIMVVLGEVFPSNIKAKAVSLVSLISNLSVAMTSFGFPLALEYLGTAICFYIFSGCCFTGIVFIYISLPETKGKTFSEIQKILAGNTENSLNKV